MAIKVAIIGAGVIGISSASALLDFLGTDGADICSRFTFDLYAELFSPHTTSDVAAGLCYTHKLGDTPTHLIAQWMGDTIEHLLKIYQTEEACLAGVSLSSGYLFLKGDEDDELADPAILSTLLSHRLVGRESFPVKGTSGFTDALSYTTTMAESNKYIPWMREKYLNTKVNFIQKKLESISELYTDYDVIINCSGIGSRDLVNDEQVYPGRGQIIKALAPWIKHSYLDNWTYVIPGTQYVTVGGTMQAGNWCLDTDEIDERDIWRRCCDMLPCLKNAKIIGEGVGLRPIRPEVKLDSRDLVTDTGKTVTVIDNYGHGMAGVTLSWGCAKQVVRLFQKAVEARQLDK